MATNDFFDHQEDLDFDLCGRRGRLRSFVPSGAKRSGAQSELRTSFSIAKGDKSGSRSSNSQPGVVFLHAEEFAQSTGIQPTKVASLCYTSDAEYGTVTEFFGSVIVQ